MYRRKVVRAVTVIDISSGSSSPASHGYATASQGGSPPCEASGCGLRIRSLSTCSSSLPNVQAALSPTKANSKYKSSTARKQAIDVPPKRLFLSSPTRAPNQQAMSRTPLTAIQPRQRQLTWSATMPSDDLVEIGSSTKVSLAAQREAAREETQRAKEAEMSKIEAAALLELPPGKKALYTRDPVEAIACIQKMRGPVAFDLEWEVAMRAGQAPPQVAVMQVADDKHILVYQLSYPKQIAKPIQDFLASREILKLGVNIAGDAQRMKHDFGVQVNGSLDLNALAIAADPNFTEPRIISLQRLAYRYLDKQLLKGSVRKSKWDTNPLRAQQIKCDFLPRPTHSTIVTCGHTDAALDVWATVQIYRRLIGYAEMSGIDLDLASLCKSDGRHKRSPAVVAAPTPVSKLSGRHVRCLAAVYQSGLVCQEGEILPFRAAADRLNVAHKTILSYLLEVSHLEPEAIDTRQLLEAIEPHFDILHVSSREHLSALRIKYAQAVGA